MWSVRNRFPEPQKQRQPITSYCIAYRNICFVFVLLFFFYTNFEAEKADHFWVERSIDGVWHTRRPLRIPYWRQHNEIIQPKEQTRSNQLNNFQREGQSSRLYYQTWLEKHKQVVVCAKRRLDWQEFAGKTFITAIFTVFMVGFFSLTKIDALYASFNIAVCFVFI